MSRKFTLYNNTIVYNRQNPSPIVRYFPNKTNERRNKSSTLPTEARQVLSTHESRQQNRNVNIEVSPGVSRRL